MRDEDVGQADFGRSTKRCRFDDTGVLSCERYREGIKDMGKPRMALLWVSKPVL
jgi:hypothetical protein